MRKNAPGAKNLNALFDIGCGFLYSLIEEKRTGCKKSKHMEIKRDKYLNALLERKGNGFIKIITGLRRCGKSYLLNEIFYNRLLSSGVSPDRIIRFSFDNDEMVDELDAYLPDEPTRIYGRGKKSYVVNSKKFRMYVKERTNGRDPFFLLLDEIQILENFVGTLNGFLGHRNFDVYVTGSNGRMLSSDIATEFRGRGDVVSMFPLSFKEYFEAFHKDFGEAYREYSYYGGMPSLTKMKESSQKANYLKNLFEEVYIKDILQRHEVADLDSFGRLIDVLASGVGSYTNPSKLEHTFKSELGKTYSANTIGEHIRYLEDSFLIHKAERYDIRGKKYIGSNAKYYFTDIGLRNARLNFRQQEPGHIMENAIYNDLLARGYSVDVGVVETTEKNRSNNSVRKQLEVDFVVSAEGDRFYVQSAYSLPDIEKRNAEERPFLKIPDSFQKIIVVNDDFKSWKTENGTKVVSLKDFLLEEDALR